MSVGANIKKRRYELRMSQQELADAMGYRTRSTIAKIESGENDVSQKKLLRFAQVLDTTAEALISGYGPQMAQSMGSVPGRGRATAIILAGGKTGKNRQNIPSQFIDVQGKPVLVYSMEAYERHPAVDGIYVVCLKGWEHIVQAYARQYGISKLRGLLPGGTSGVASLKNAVEHLKGKCAPEDTVIIQEATRPLVAADTVTRLLQACEEKGSATMCHRMTEYVQFDLSGHGARYVDRDALIALQSPEAHRMERLEELFAAAARKKHPLTESCCTMLLYNMGYEINFIESNVNNIKLSREEDLAAFGALVR